MGIVTGLAGGMLSGIWKAIKAVVMFVAGLFAGLFTWLQTPGAKLKAVCAVLALGFAWSAMVAYSRGNQIIVVANQCKVDKGLLVTKAKQDQAVLLGNITDKDAKLQAITDALNAQADQLKLLREQNAGLAAEVKRRTLEAERSAAGFHKTYEGRSDQCKAALLTLKQACPAMGSY